MKDYIKSYHMFFPNKMFGILLYIVYPLAVWGLVFAENMFIKNIYVILFAPVSVFIIECIADFFVFAGYSRKDTNRNEYLKTSVYYTNMLKRAVLADIIRRLLSSFLIIFVPAAVLKVPYNITIFALVSVNFFIVISLCILRYFDFFAVYQCITSIILVLYIAFSVLVSIKNIFIEASIVMLLLSIILILFHIKVLFKVVKEEYYD